MSMLYVWDPGWMDGLSDLDVILTRGDSDQVGGGSARFLSSIAGALGLSPSPERGSIRSYRCNFYSEYWEEGGWTRQWDFVWRLSIHFKKQFSLKKLARSYIGIDEIDDYSPSVESYKHPPFNCLVVGEFDTEKRAQNVANKIINDEKIGEARRAAQAPTPSIDVLRVAAKRFHLRADIGNGDRRFFESGYPGTVVSMLEANGGSIHTKS